MPEVSPPQDRKRGGGSRTLIYVMLAIVVACIAAFLVLRPNPSGQPTAPARQH